jgi:hypothetical protein
MAATRTRFAGSELASVVVPYCTAACSFHPLSLSAHGSFHSLSHSSMASDIASHTCSLCGGFGLRSTLHMQRAAAREVLLGRIAGLQSPTVSCQGEPMQNHSHPTGGGGQVRH